MKMRLGALVVLAAAVLLAAAAAPSASQPSALLPVRAGQVSAFAFDPVNPRIVYVGTIPGPNKGRVYKLTGGGGQWRLISGKGWTWLGALAADPRHSGTLYAGTGNEVYKTTNGGRTWRASNKGLLPPPGVNRGEGWVDWLSVDPSGAAALYEKDYAGTLRKSVDGGRSWRVAAWRPRFGAIEGARIAWARRPTIYAWSGRYPRHGAAPFTYGLYRSRDGGRSWRKTGLSVSVGAQPQPSLGSGLVVEVDSRHPSTLYAALQARVFMSTDAGEQWQSIGSGLPRDADVTSLAIGAGTLYVACGTNGIYETADRGRTWTQSWPRSGRAPGLGATLVAVDPARPATVFAASYSAQERSTGTRVLRSTDSGRTWKVVG